MQKRDYKASIPLYEQALLLAEKEYGKKHENYFVTRNDLGWSMMCIKNKAEVEAFLLDNIELTKAQGEKTVIYAQALHNI